MNFYKSDVWTRFFTLDAAAAEQPGYATNLAPHTTRANALARFDPRCGLHLHAPIFFFTTARYWHVCHTTDA